jgi:formate hydrogenlyase subunit 6/NADH:ubiquinone oxidoreductase subunit I
MPQHANFRGEEFVWYDSRCTGCASCAKYCPLGIIKIVTGTSGVNEQEGQSYDIEVFDIDIGRCMFCGLCVEACPYDALHMGSGFEEGKYRRSDLVINVDQLKSAEKKPSTWFRPQLTNQGYDPIKGSTADWEEVGRHEKPSLEDQNERWAKR